MANQDAWQAGIDIAQGKRGKKGDNDDSQQTGVTQPRGGLFGAIDNARQNRKSRSALQKAQNPDRSLASVESPDLGNVQIPQAKKGGRVTKGGLVRVHRGEHIVPAKHARKALRKRTVTKH